MQKYLMRSVFSQNIWFTQCAPECRNTLISKRSKILKFSWGGCSQPPLITYAFGTHCLLHMPTPQLLQPTIHVVLFMLNFPALGNKNNFEYNERKFVKHSGSCSNLMPSCKCSITVASPKLLACQINYGNQLISISYHLEFFNHSQGV